MEQSYAKAVETIDRKSLEITNEEQIYRDLFAEKHIDNNVLNAYNIVTTFIPTKMDEYSLTQLKTYNGTKAETGTYPNVQKST